MAGHARETMARWFTADLHLGHTNIIRYCHRPFSDAAEMDRALVDRWNETVAPGDEVWVLGDFALGTIAHTLPLAHELHGRKVLLAGNHDRCFPGLRKAEEWEARYLEAGFAEVRNGQAELTVGGTDVVACHFPYVGDSHDHDRYLAQRPVDDGRWLLHGHVHDTWLQHDRMINVGVDAWDLRPVGEDVIAALIAAGPRDLGVEPSVSGGPGGVS